MAFRVQWSKKYLSRRCRRVGYVVGNQSVTRDCRRFFFRCDGCLVLFECSCYWNTSLFRHSNAMQRQSLRVACAKSLQSACGLSCRLSSTPTQVLHASQVVIATSPSVRTKRRKARHSASQHPFPVGLSALAYQKVRHLPKTLGPFSSSLSCLMLRNSDFSNSAKNIKKKDKKGG